VQQKYQGHFHVHGTIIISCHEEKFYSLLLVSEDNYGSTKKKTPWSESASQHIWYQIKYLFFVCDMDVFLSTSQQLKP
jgi:hypothetical protein